jgi:hypothetical protein
LDVVAGVGLEIGEGAGGGVGVAGDLVVVNDVAVDGRAAGLVDAYGVW